MSTSWLTNIKTDTAKFLEVMSDGSDFSYFKYSLSGDVFTRKDKWGLGNLVFATKIAHMVSVLDNERSISLGTAIAKFSHKDGEIYDPFITSQSIIDKLRRNTSKHKNKTRRAETRQAFAALRILGIKPEAPYTLIPYTETEIDDYLSALNWSLPWDAGSHLSHLLFFLKTNSLLFDYKRDQSQALIDYAVSWVNRLQSAQDGTWFTGTDVSLKERINGAMKVLTGFQAAGVDALNNAEQLIDTALVAANDEEACSNFNVVFVLYCASQFVPDYRVNEIQRFLENRLELYKEFYYPEFGGFSFHRHQANDIYYGKKISLGKDEPDIHGTTLFLWGIALISRMMDIGVKLEVPIT